MIIELTIDVAVRVPEERLPLGTKSAVFHMFKTGSKVNYSSSRRDPDHMAHTFSGHAGKYGILTYTCVTPRSENPNWL